MKITPGMQKAIGLIYRGDVGLKDCTVVKGPTRDTRYGPEINAGVAAKLLKAGVVERHEWSDGTITLRLADDMPTQQLVAELLDLPLCLICNTPSEESPYCDICWQEIRP